MCLFDNDLKRKMASYYAQFQTDFEIKKYFPENYRGTCIEVGAGFGLHLSNTGHFEELGWKCLCIEPIPELFKNLRMYRRLCLNLACGEKDSENQNFSVFVLKNGNIEAISSLNTDQRLITSHKDLIDNIYNIKVQVKTLNSILDKININHIDFISIDTGGNELETIKGFNLLKWKVKLLVIQNNFNESFIADYLINFGYEFKERHGVNDFFEYCKNNYNNQISEINKMEDIFRL